MKKMYKRILIILCLMLFIAIMGSSVSYWLTPKVRTVSIQMGPMSYRCPILKLTVVSNSIVPIKAGDTLPQGLTIIDIIPAGKNSVSAGDVLLQLDMDELSSALRAAQKAYYASYGYQMEYELGFAQAKKDAETAYAKAKAALERNAKASEATRQRYQTEFDYANIQYQQLVVLGSYQGTTPQIVAEECRQAKAQLDMLETLQAQKGRILAPCNGYVLAIHAAKGDQVVPGDTLFELLPDNQSWQMDVQIEGDTVISVGQDISLTTEKKEICSASVAACVYKEGENCTYVRTEYIPGLSPSEVLRQAAFLRYDSLEYMTLVPNEAFIASDKIYVVQNIYTDNRFQDSLQEMKVTPLPGNDQYTPVLESLSDLPVVTYWDRSIRNGQAVIVEK